MKIAIGADHAGFELKSILIDHLREQEHDLVDVGTYSTVPVDYPAICAEVARRVVNGAAERGIVLGGSGQGEQMAANKIPGARAALCNDLYTARLSRQHNDANVLGLGARIVAPGLAVEIVELWLSTRFEGGRHQRRVAALDALSGPADAATPAEGGVTTASVTDQLMALAGGDPFEAVRLRSEEHQLVHGCGLHNAGAPVMALAASYVRVAGARRLLDLGCGIGYSTLWLARAAGPDSTVVGIDDDPAHIAEAERLADQNGLGDRVSYVTGRAADVLPTLQDRFDAVHDDAWFATPPAHLDPMIELLRPGGLLTMPNWFLLVDALNGRPRRDWSEFAGPTWAEDATAYATGLAARPELDVTWVERPPLGVAVKRR